MALLQMLVLHLTQTNEGKGKTVLQGMVAEEGGERFCRETYRMLWKLRNKTPNLVWGIQNHFPEDMTSKLNLEGQREFGLGLLQMRNYTRKRKKERKYALNDIFFLDA